MIDERINKTLSELESNLRNVQSARQQVEKTVNAYNGLTSSMSTYINSLSAVNDKLSQIVSLVESDYKGKVAEFESDRTKIVDSCSKAIENINTTAEDVKNTVSSCIDNIHKRFKYLYIINAAILTVIILLHFIR